MLCSYDYNFMMQGTNKAQSQEDQTSFRRSSKTISISLSMESEDGIIFMYSLLGSLNQEASLSLKVQYWNLLNVLFIVWVLHT